MWYITKKFLLLLIATVIFSFGMVSAFTSCDGTIPTGNAGAGYGATGRAATLTIAALDSTAIEKSQADYVCTSNSSAAWITALAALPAGGGGIIAYSGHYTFSQNVTISKPVVIKGQGYNTYFSYNGSGAVFVLTSDNTSLSDLRTDAGGINTASVSIYEWVNVVVGTTGYALKNGTTTIGNSALTFDTSAITSGTMATARLGSGTANTSSYLRGDSSWVSSADAALIASGVLGTARLGSGSASASTYLRGDGTWVTSGAKTKFLPFTRDMTAGSGDVSYSGFGFTPSAIIISATDNVTATSSATAYSGFTVGGSGFYYNYGVTVSIMVGTVVNLSDATGSQRAVIKSWDADGFTLTWTKVSSPTGTAYIRVFAFE